MTGGTIKWSQRRKNWEKDDGDVLQGTQTVQDSWPISQRFLFDFLALLIWWGPWGREDTLSEKSLWLLVQLYSVSSLLLQPLCYSSCSLYHRLLCCLLPSLLISMICLLQSLAVFLLSLLTAISCHLLHSLARCLHPFVNHQMMEGSWASKLGLSLGGYFPRKEFKGKLVVLYSNFYWTGSVQQHRRSCSLMDLLLVDALGTLPIG